MMKLARTHWFLPLLSPAPDWLTEDSVLSVTSSTMAPPCQEEFLLVVEGKHEHVCVCVKESAHTLCYLVCRHTKNRACVRW